MIRALVAGGILLTSGVAVATPITIDFETDDDGVFLGAGTVVDDEYSDFGVNISSSSSLGRPVMIFDSANPTGGDNDLRTPGYGPGNTNALGNILIISEDGDSSDPDDNAGGGTIIFDFDTAVQMTSVGILDIDTNEGGRIQLFDASSTLLGTFEFANAGDNSFQSIRTGLGNVRRMDVIFDRSGALTDLTFTTHVPAPATLALLGLGLLGVGYRRRQRG